VLSNRTDERLSGHTPSLTVKISTDKIMELTRERKRDSRLRKAILETISDMKEREISKAFTLMESGPVVLVTTND
jgi:hypothetical protein